MESLAETRAADACATVMADTSSQEEVRYPLGLKLFGEEKEARDRAIAEWARQFVNPATGRLTVEQSGEIYEQGARIFGMNPATIRSTIPFHLKPTNAETLAYARSKRRATACPPVERDTHASDAHHNGNSHRRDESNGSSSGPVTDPIDYTNHPAALFPLDLKPSNLRPPTQRRPRPELQDYDDSYQARRNGHDPDARVLSRGLDKESAAVLQEFKAGELTEFITALRRHHGTMIEFLREGPAKIAAVVDALNSANDVMPAISAFGKVLQEKEAEYAVGLAERDTRIAELERRLDEEKEYQVALEEEIGGHEARWRDLRGILGEPEPKPRPAVTVPEQTAPTPATA